MGPFFAFFPRKKEGHKLFLEAQKGGFGMGAKKCFVEKVYVFFRPLERERLSLETAAFNQAHAGEKVHSRHAG